MHCDPHLATHMIDSLIGVDRPIQRSDSSTKVATPESRESTKPWRERKAILIKS